MKIKRFTVANMQAGLSQISELLGPEAVILSNRRLADGLEIVAGVDEQEYERYVASKPAEPESDIIKASPGRPSEPLNQETMTELFSAMANKNRQAFESVSQKAAVPEATHKAAASNRPAATVSSRPAAVSENELSSEPPKNTLETEVLHTLRREIDGLKVLLKEQTEQLKEPVSAEMSPQYERLEARLTALGFGASLTRRLMQGFDREDPLDLNWRRIMSRLASALPVPLYEPLSGGGVYALAGPTGAGKTTTIAKLAAHGVRDFGQEGVVVISLDWFQAGGQAMLKSVADILGIQCLLMKETDHLDRILETVAEKKLVLIDTSGSAEAMVLWDRLMRQPILASKIKNLLVVPATMHGNAIGQFMGRLKEVIISGVILSKVDEAACFGSVLEPVLKHHWPLWFVTTGQQIPQDIEIAEAKLLIKRLVQGLKSEPVALATAG